MTRHIPGGLGRLQVHDGQLHLEVLDDAGHHLATTLPLDRTQRHALHHLHAVQTARTGAADDHQPVVDALLAALEALQARPVALVVDGGPPTSFRLALAGPAGEREVAVDVVDAAALIFSRRVPLRVLAPALDWDRTVSELLSS